MTKSKSLREAGWTRLLALLLAVLIWLAVVVERPGEVRIRVAVRPVGIPSGLRLVSPPGPLELVVSGPRIVLGRLWFVDPVCELDLSGAAAGTADFTPLDGDFGLDREARVVRSVPARLRLTLAGGAAVK